MPFRVSRALNSLKATAAPPCGMGEEGFAPGGVPDHGTQEEDGPGTWEAPVSPRKTPDHTAEGVGAEGVGPTDLLQRNDLRDFEALFGPYSRDLAPKNTLLTASGPL